MRSIQRFVVPNGRPHPRWREAFENIEVAVSVGTEAAGATVWVSTAVPAWEQGVSALAEAGTRVVVLSSLPEVAQAARALELGARGYLHELAAPELLRRVADIVEADGIWLGPDLMHRLVVAARVASAQSDGGGEDASLLLTTLTDREREVALAVAEGKTNKEVARDLGIVERTVKAHLAEIFRKLGVRDRLRLALLLSAATHDRLPL